MPFNKRPDQKQDPSGLVKTRPLRIAKIVPLRFGKNSTLRIGKNSTPTDLQNWDPSGLAKLGPLRIGKIGTPPDWQNWDPPDWQIETPPDWKKQDPSGLHPSSPVLSNYLRIARARPIKFLRAITLPKTIWFSIHTNQLQTLFNLDLVSRISEFRPVLFWSGLLLEGKLPVQSLVPSLSLNNQIPLTIIFSSVYFSLKKIMPLGIGRNSTPPYWHK